MAALGQEVTVTTGATLIFEVIDLATYNANGFTPGANPNIFPAREPSDPLPLIVTIPSGATVFLGGSGVTASGAGVGCPLPGPATLPYNVTGSDSLYGIVGSSTAVVGLLAMRQ